MEYYLTKDELYHSSIQSQKYGVPEQKKFPLFDLDHVKSAIKFFNYVDPKYEDQLAKAILRKAKEYGLDLSEMSIGDNNRFKKYLPNDELKHHGILGQKWGVRRYQNEDGTYTEAGKVRRKEYFDYAKKAKYGQYSSDRARLVKEISNQKIDDYVIDVAKEQHIASKNYIRLAEKAKQYYKAGKNLSKKDTEDLKYWERESDYYNKELRRRINEKAKEFLGDYGNVKVDRSLKVSNIKNVSDLLTSDLMVQAWVDVDEYFDDKIWESTVNGSTKYGKKTIETANSSIDRNKSNIAKEVSKGMISDIKRWAKEGDKKSQTLLKNNKLQEEFEKKVNNNINNRDKDSVFVYSDGTLDFTLDGFDEYQESQPLRVEYNPKTKKVNFDYL